MKTILHIVNDEKFIDTASHRFEAVSPGANRFVIVGELKELEYVSHTQIDFLTELELVNLVSKGVFKAVIFHSLQAAHASILNAVHPKTYVCWLGWGYDYYDLLLHSYFPDGLVLSETKELWLPKREIIKRSFLRRFLSFSKRKIKRILCAVSVLPPLPVTNKSEAPLILDTNRVDFFSPVLELEYDMAIQGNPGFRPKYVRWNYQFLSHCIAPQPQKICKDLGENILVGNSATPTNNHVEIFNWISSSKSYSDRKIIVPLNYGDKNYADKICDLGLSLFGESFIPLREWMPIDEYFKILDSCGFAVFGHLRQQGAGNVHKMLSLGAKVYMHSNSPLYKNHASNSVRLFCFDECVEKGDPINLTPLTQKEQEKNAEIMDQWVELPPHFPKTRKLIELFQSPRR